MLKKFFLILLPDAKFRSLVLMFTWFPATLFLILISILGIIYFKNNAIAPGKNLSNPSLQNKVLGESNPTFHIRITPNTDIRITIVKKFLANHGSPLADFASDLVYASDINGLDYTFLPAIAMQESNGCKKAPADSHNCWGYGIYGGKIKKFSSYKDAIYQVAKTLREAYIKKGKTNATLVEDIWTPSSSGQWSYGVNFFISEIRQME
jgi:hypothetical protein